MIITRDIIRDDATFNTHSKHDLCEFINYWKVKLLDLGAKPGDKIGLSFDNAEIHYYAIIFAAFELGMRVISLHRPNSEKECLSPKSNAHLPLDYFVYLNHYLSSPLTSQAIRHFRKNSTHLISYGRLEWETSCDSFRSSQETPVYAQPNDIAFCTTSSGTTGDPKLITYTHQFLYDLCHHNWKDLRYNENDRMVHFSNLNHGGVITLLLPSLMICKEHHFKTFYHGFDTVYGYVKDCVKDNITKIFFANGGEVNCFLASMREHNVKMPDLSIFLLSFISPAWKEYIKNGHLKSIMSPFGCSEVCGPVFMPYLDINNVDTFNPKFLGKPLSGFYDTRIENNRIYTKVNGEEFVFDDIVNETQDGVYFVSKTRLKKINDIDINPLDIVELVEKYYSRYLLEVYVDEVYNELYIISSSKSLHEMKEAIKSIVKSFYFGNVELTDIIYDPKLHDTLINHKADKDKLKGIVEKYRLTFHKNSL